MLSTSKCMPQTWLPAASIGCASLSLSHEPTDTHTPTDTYTPTDTHTPMCVGAGVQHTLTSRSLARSLDCALARARSLGLA
jgi:hypothetical protein